MNSCFLKTKNLRYKEFIISLDGTTINFSRQARDQGEVKVRHSTDIKGAHVKMGTMEIEQNSQQCYYSIVVMLTPNMMQSVYFESKSLRKSWYHALLA